MSTETEIVIGGDSADIPDGEYQGKLDTIEVRPGVKFEGDFRVWTFTLDNGSQISGTSSMGSGPKTKAYRWIRALLGRKPEQGERVRLAGRPCTVVVEANDAGWPAVSDILPAKATQSPDGTAAGPLPAAAAVPDDLPF